MICPLHARCVRVVYAREPSVCVYVCERVCERVCVVYVCARVVCTNKCVCVFVYVCVCAHVYFVCVCVHVCARVCVCDDRT